MKLVLQIALGVFLGALAAQLVTAEWRSYRAERVQEAERQKVAEEERVLKERRARARELLLRQLQGKMMEDQLRHAEPEAGGKQEHEIARPLPPTRP